MPNDQTIVIKIGGSTLGNHDTTLEDVAELQRRGLRPVVVHGGGALISDWLRRLDVPTRFERGLRVTDAASLKVVVAVLAGLVNKEIVASLQSLGANAMGLSGADGGILRCRIVDEALGFVGEIESVDPSTLRSIMGGGASVAVNGLPAAQRINESLVGAEANVGGAVPVVAPIGLLYQDDRPTAQLLNINADTAAGAITAALGASRLVFMTDVSGVKAEGAVLPELSAGDARKFIESGVIEGGMIPKVEACLAAAAAGARATIIDGREEHALRALIGGSKTGTIVG